MSSVIVHLIMNSNMVFVDGETIKNRYEEPMIENYDFPADPDSEFEIDFYDRETGLLDLRKKRKR